MLDGTRCSEYELVYNNKKELINHLLAKYPDTISSKIPGYYIWKQFEPLRIKAIHKIWILNHNEIIEESKPKLDAEPIRKTDKLTIALINKKGKLLWFNLVRKNKSNSFFKSEISEMEANLK
jgi:hypothetical protein